MRLLIALTLLIVPHWAANGELPFSKFTNEQVVALTLLGEARSEGELGMRAVYTVVYNRGLSKLKKQNTVNLALVCLENKQFSFWNNRESVSFYNKLLNSKQGKVALQIVKTRNKIQLESRHYHAKYCKPEWADKNKIEAIIGNHVFYKDI